MQNEQGISPPDAATGSPKRKWLLVGAVALVVIVVAVIAIVVFNNKPKSSSSQTTKLSSAAGLDLLEEKPRATAIKYQNVPIIQACNLFTLADVKNAKLELLPNAAADAFVFERHYFNGQGSANVNTGDRESLNNCRYGLKDGEVVKLSFFQPTYVHNPSMQTELGRYTPTTDISGLKAYKHDSDYTSKTFGTKTSEYLLQTGDSFARATLLYQPDSTLGASLPQILIKIAENLRREATKPSGPATIAYNAAAFPESYANACSISKPEDFTAVFNATPMPHVTEGFATQVGSIYFNDDPDRVRYPYLRHHCVRALTVEIPVGEVSLPEDKELEIETTTYLTDEASKKQMSFNKKVTQTKAPSQKIGDEAFIVTTKSPSFSKPGILVFRHGRVVVQVLFVDPADPKTKDSTLANTSGLEKAAAGIAARMNDF